MKTGAFHKKIIYNHLLALALAGIVSLLFLQTVCQFLNTKSKRSDYVANIKIGSCGSQNSMELSFLQIDSTPESGMNGFLQVEGIFSFNLQSRRFGKLFHILTLDQNFNLELKRYSKTLYRYSLPLVGGPSIPIAHRRLII